MWREKSSLLGYTRGDTHNVFVKAKNLFFSSLLQKDKHAAFSVLPVQETRSW